ncbi:recombination regulator RecX [Silvimonas amylolytica]|uniref:Regulatory protein RecX n=1 Tax=Silvimonas amylolytica TaxID=449663 RepID=A0ABQ2PH08_9NEIS|nr:recombination regulator RecX [Silvimonas amylolytica]GGP24656.1 regulatory protein RecX [Silvimonas amylolytica]
MHIDDDVFEESDSADRENDGAAVFDAARFRNRALALLSRREYSRAELRAKLRPHCPDAQILDELLDDFQQRKWLSDERFAEQWAHYRSQRYGTRRLVAELRQKGVSSDIISNTLENLETDEFTTARALWLRKFGQPPQDAKERAKQLRFLAARGFSTGVIYRVVGGEDDSDHFDD